MKKTYTLEKFMLKPSNTKVHYMISWCTTFSLLCLKNSGARGMYSCEGFFFKALYLRGSMGIWGGRDCYGKYPCFK